MACKPLNDHPIWRRQTLLFDDSVLISGEVDRTSDIEHGMPFHEVLARGACEPDPLILYDQALNTIVADHGQVVRGQPESASARGDLTTLRVPTSKFQ